MLLSLLHFHVVSPSDGMEYGRNLHRTSKGSHTILKSISPSSSPSSSSSSSSSSTSSSDGSDGHSERPPRHRVPVIRVVHIFNPTVIKTDAANFRSLVQELTGRSCSNDTKVGTVRSKSRQSCASVPEPESNRILVPPHILKLSMNTPPRRNPIYIPERLGTFSDIDIMSSFQEPVMDLSSMLPSLGGMEINDEGLPRFSF
ncbi:uncharacterized protein LOC112351364 [Selaginella moellendorffii]|uniref:uncharacterized protein LOC112351364 n=1 Tax=Selaginella moellendorffii TaxID=88036 RepID=UPI000D1CAB2C|nr:uncharacterized protein LOC112351364 [Selaginella moellendorffii]|eukprot:XP_024544884.1 uncharacterized protein LOC112351364 [Selaginella moellendorffii]